MAAAPLDPAGPPRTDAITAARLHLLQFAVRHSLEDLLEETVNEAEKLTQSVIGFYHFVQEDQQALTLQTWSTRTKAEFCRAEGKHRDYPIRDAGLWGECVAQRQPVIHNDCAALPGRKGLPPGHAELTRVLVIPVIRADRVVALLGVGNKPADYAPPDVEVAALLADLAWEVRECKRSEERLSLLDFALNHVRDEAYLIDGQGRFQYVNDEACRALGRTREELLALDVPAVDPDFDATRWREHWADLHQRGSLTFEGHHRTREGRVYPVEISANYFEYGGTAYNLALARDTSGRKHVELELARVNRALRMLSDSNQALIRITAEPALLAEICRIVVEVGGYRMAAVAYAEHDDAQTLRPVAHAGFDEGYVAAARVSWGDNERGQGPGGRAVRTGQACVVRDVSTDPAFAPWRDEAQRRGYHAVAAMPLVSEGTTLGTLAVYSGEAEVFDVSEVAILRELAGDLAFGITSLRVRAKRDRFAQDLAKSESKYRALIHRIRAGVIVHGPDTRILTSNAVAQDLLGLTEAQLLGKSATDPAWHFLREDGSPMPQADYPVNQVLATQRPLRNLVLGVRRPPPDQARDTWILVNADPVTENGDVISEVVVTFIDISVRRAAELALREQERHAQSLLRLSRGLERSQTYEDALQVAQDEVRSVLGYQDLWVYLFAQDRKTARLLVANGPIRGVLLASENVVTLTIPGDPMLEEIAAARDIVVVEDARTDPRTDKAIVARIGNRTIINVPIVLMDHPLGAVGTGTFGDAGVRVPSRPERDYLMTLASHMAVAFDRLHLLAERKRSLETLREHEAFVRNILDSVDEGFIVVDREYRIVAANRAYCELVDQPEAQVLGRRCYEATHALTEPCFAAGSDCAVRRTFEDGGSHAAAHEHLRPGGAKRYVELKSYPILDAAGAVVSAIETVNDVTDRRVLEEQLRQSQKMEAIGTLAGGVAHDFNNILMAIIGCAGIVKGEMKPDDPLQPMVDQIIASSDRAANLTRGLLAFSRKQILEPRPVDLNDVVRSIEKLLRRLIGEDVSLAVDLTGKTLVAMVDPGQIDQVLMNLVTNARDAMPDGGAMTITTRRVELGPDFIATHGFGEPGSHALIAVSDSGVGMDARTRSKLFEPFFTTKEPGKGTGLGLAIVYGIIKQHSGAIDVYSEPGVGTTVKVYLPLLATQPEDAPAPAVVRPRGGSETVLLAEDDRDVRTVTVSLLKDFGYRVIEAVDGQDALDKFAAAGGTVDLLVLDVIMPRKSGKDVYDVVKAQRPDTGVLFLSGYTADVIHRKGISGDNVDFISKPVSPYDLLHRIRAILDRRGARAGR